MILHGNEMKLPLAEFNPVHAQHTLKAHIYFLTKYRINQFKADALDSW